MGWQTLKVGAGGFATGLDIDPDGTRVVRTDTNGAYLWNGTQWVQLVTSSSMPAAFDFSGQGVYEIQMAPSNSSIMYMMFDGHLFKSTNKGTTWTQTAFTPVSANPNDSYRYNGQKMAIDPNNPNIVYVGTSSSGLFVSKDGGSTWSKVSAIPAAAGQGITGILFDPAIKGAVNGVTQTIFASSYGHGVYESTDGGTSWTALTGGPSDVVSAAVSSTGVYYASDGSNLWGYAGGKWTKLASDSAGIQAVAVNPSNPNEIVAVSGAGYLDISYNAGATWTGTMWSSNQVTSADIPWLAAANKASAGNVYMTVGGAAFNPANPSQMVISAGTGVWTTTQVPTSGATSSTPVTWTDQSVGIENLVANEIIVPPGGDPVLASWDRPFFKITNPNSYPTTYGPVASDNIVAGWSVDYASSSPSFLVGIADWWGTEESGYSTNGGQTWTKFPTEIPGAGSSFMGGTIAASTTQNFIWAPAGGQKPYYTLNGGSTWTPITLPGVSSWSGFDWAYYLDQRSVTADRVLANTFYLYDPGKGVFETTNGGASWTNVHSGYIESNGSMAGFNSTIMSVPGEAGNLFYTGGSQSGATPTAPVNEGFYRSTDGGKTWSTVANVLDVSTFGFGAAAPGQSSPAIYIVGYVNSVYGIWQSINNAQSWSNIGTYPNGELDPISTISGNPNVFGEVYVGFGDGGGYAYLPAGSGTGATTGGTGTGPTIIGISDSPATGDLNAGDPVALTLAFSENVTVAGGAPTLTLNDGGTATYVSGSGTSALTFSYTVAAGQNTPDLMVTAVNLPTGATIDDASGNAANLALSSVTQSSPQIDTTTPTIIGISDSPATGDLNVGKTVALTLAFSENVTVAGGAPTLTLNDGGTATYVSGSGTSALTFSYTVAAGQNTPDLMVTAVNLPTGATIDDASGNAANLALSSVTQSSPQIDTTTPTIIGISDSPATGDLNVGKTVALTLAFSENVTVAGGAPTLTLNDGGTATYVSGSGTSALTFSYTVAAGQNTPDLMVTAVNLPTGATIDDASGNAANLALSSVTQSSPQIDTTTPTIIGISDSPATGDLNAGDTVALTLAFSENVTVAGGAPTLTLNDGGTATYVSGSGTSALTFSYTVAAGQNTPDLMVTAVNLPTGATIDDASGNAANLALSSVTQSSPQIDTTTPTIIGISDSPATGDLNAGDTVALTLAFSENVTVAGGAPTLTLNDGGTATYVSGSGTSALTFSYTVAAGQNTPDLMVTAVNLPTGATIDDASGNAANLALSSVTQSSPQIDTTTPTIIGISDSPATGDLNAGDTVALTLAFSENVTVAGGAPTLTLNDGGTATYVSGSGTSALTFSYTVAAGQNTPDLMVTAVNLPTGATIDDASGNAANLALSSVTQSSPQIDTTTPTIIGISDSPATGDLNVGKTVALTLAFSENVTVAGGAPTLTLNDGGTATYVSGSGTSALTFSYTVAAGQNTPDLMVTAVNLPTGATIDDASGNAANLALSSVTQSSPQIDTTTPTIIGISDSPATGDLNVGKTVALTLAFSENVTVAGGAPTLTLNDGGTATYVSGSGTSALTFSYTVAAGQNTPDLMVTAVNLPTGATIDDASGNAANLALSSVTQSSPQIDTTTPTIIGISDSPATGDLNAGDTVALTLAFSENVTVAGGAPTLTLNDGGTATYVSGSGTSALTFSYTVAAGQNTPDLMVTAVNLPTGATIDDASGNAANLALSSVTQSSPQIDTTTPTIIGISDSPATGDLNVGKTVALTLAFSENVTVAGGAPTLTLNDGGTATYVSGSGTSALTFSYTVAAGQNTPDLMVTAVNLPTGATIDDASGNAANLALSSVTQSSPQIDTTTPTIIGISDSPATGDLNVGKTVALTLAFSENVTVAGGRPTLTLSDGGTAFYYKGSGTKTLTFNYTVAAGQSTASLAATAVNLASGVTIKDSAGHAANLSLAGLTQHGPQIDGVTPTVTSVVASPPTGDLNAGDTVTLTLNFSEPVTLAGVAPTLTLNDRGTATYVSGSGSKALTFKYTVASGQNTASLAALWATLPSGATIKNSAGTEANLSLAGLTQTGPQIDTIAPAVTSVVASPAKGTQLPGDAVTITVKMSEAVTVGGAPTLSLNDGGSAKYISGSGTNTLTFKYTIGSSDKDVSALAISAVGLPAGAKILDGAGNVANMAGAIHSFAGLAVDPPIVTTKPDGSYDVAYSEVTGLSYSSYEDIYNSAGVQIAEARDLIGGAGTLVLDANQLSISSSSGSLGVTTGSDTFKVNSHANESIIASGRAGETFAYGSGFGHESITGLLAGGTSSDVIKFSTSMFKGLNPTNTSTQNWDALISSGAAVQSGANVTITDAAHDILTLNSVTTSMLSQHAGSAFKFV